MQNYGGIISVIHSQQYGYALRASFLNKNNLKNFKKKEKKKKRKKTAKKKNEERKEER